MGELTTLPRILTPQEVSDYLRVSTEIVISELKSGRLRGFKIGQEWRCSESELMSYINRLSTEGDAVEAQLTDEEPHGGTKFKEIGSFDFAWPKKGGGPSMEHYDHGYETIRSVDGNNYVFRIGFGNREVAGLPRRRVTVWIEKRAIVEFAGSNNYEEDGLLAGVIRLRNGKQLSPSDRVPVEYRDFKVSRYNSIVNGPRASTNMAVVVGKDDLDDMIRHAVIRATWKDIT